MSAWLGLVPRQYGTGGKMRLGAISKRGSMSLRRLLIHGARSVLTYVHKRSDALSEWIKAVIERRGKHKAVVAMANKTTRIVWVVLNKGIDHVPACYLKPA